MLPHASESRHRRAGHFPDYDQYVRELAENLTNVVFRGTFPNEKLTEVFASFDVLAIPSLWHENSPLALLSAFALKTPPLVSKIGSLADLVEHGKSGLLFEMGDAEDLASQLKKFIDEPQLLEQLRAGIPAVRTIDQNIEELLEIYTGLSDKRDERIASIPESLPERPRRSGSMLKTLKMLTKGAQFRESLVLLQCTVVIGSEQLGFDFEWHSPGIPVDWTVFIHLVDENEETPVWDYHRLLHYDQDPWGFIAYRYTMRLPLIHMDKDFRIRVGVVDRKTNTPLPVIRTRAFTVDPQGDAVSVGNARLTAAAGSEQARGAAV